ncbi:chromosome segregation protein SMC [Acidithiobacillus sp. CV18-2]|uniref:Chromosome partition protein Smc n=1 Tax=Igneacidithiobacillus copahuensis TaxID=2724909 RepID=A0AAE3CKQ5_9PROT|nr:chromosome segregation protein SMC [Igneacidithiobacillus copahuensis]MBU2753824.1 chromosome segregation protein SMC [Acidithiobacillus sp. CV18-3]MBU2756586.1 chromosome segregation protein SMC [Acidithiobacillus sp. BN09-2]MBU2777462.1 chromosome segregation protein SMC [Acidithiobacillus sp. CV18-2]MBU2796176.1 chromosome segregation protein SMC [Acidithiobacillus sp. VAN18-2]MBU2799879.1 chromosome segregation protein SMC [Acidithiobacillus sp. VAN18-4]UTV82150.1 chromosome segregatio
MRLSAIHLHGFKSFRNATRIDVQRNPLVIVGPNGCGKSNIIDAIRWVLGESSARQLRGGAMADVISNGSTSRGAAQQAVVELLFDNSTGKAPAPWTASAEIRVQRRLSRDGDSQYRINDARCRRRDVGDLFLGTGLGASSYAIIEQGTIGRIIESRPEDLRAMLEEAGGISRYKERRRETEQRIAETREHLQRLRDIYGEMEQQYQRLTRQAEQARKLRELRQEERRWQWWELVLHLEAVAAEQAQMQDELATTAALLQAMQEEELRAHVALDARRNELAQQEEQLREAQAEQYAAQAEQTMAEQDWQRLQEEGKRLQRRQKEERERHAHIEEEKARRVRQLQEAQSRLQGLQERERVRSAEEQQLRVERERLDRAVRDAELAQQAVRDKLQDWRRQVEVREAQWRELQPRIAEMEQRRARLGNPSVPAPEELATRQARVDEATGERERVEAALAATEQNLARLATTIEQFQEEWQKLRDELQRRRAQRDALERLARGLQKKGPSAADRALSGILAVDAEWERATELVLGERLHAILSETETLPSGSGSWLWISPVKPDASLPEDALWHRLRLDEPWKEALLPWLWGLRCCPDLPSATARIAELQVGEHWLTPNGELLCATGLWRLGTEEDTTSWLRVRRELEELSIQLPDLECQATLAETVLRNCREELTQARGQGQNLRRQAQEAQTKLAQAREKLAEWQSTLAAAEQRAAAEREECEHLDVELQQLRQRHAGLDEELRRERTRASGLRQQEEEARRGLEDRRREQQEQRQRFARMRDEGQRAALEQQRLENEQRMAEERLQSLREEGERATQALADLEGAQGRWRADLPGAEERRSLQVARRITAQQRLAQIQEAGEQLRQQLRTLDQQRQAGQQQQRQSEVQRAKQEAKLAHLEERHQELLQKAQELAAILGENPGPMPANSTPQTELQRLQAAIARLGNVNLAAEEELTELQERQGDLAAQVADVDQALLSLESAMAAMDAETLERFQRTLEQVNRGLQKYFVELFGGGVAALAAGAGDPLDAGLVLRAQPPGKRNSTLQQLSGGEKALTAIALVFAIFALNPAPFCILDEVDAPLDDANIERFCRLLRELAKETQFLLISHRQLTLQVAEQLVGVTMIEPGISSIVPVDVAALLAEDGVT